MVFCDSELDVVRLSGYQKIRMQVIGKTGHQGVERATVFLISGFPDARRFTFLHFAL